MTEPSPSSLRPNNTLFSDKSPTILPRLEAAKHFGKLVLLAKHQVLRRKLAWLCLLEETET